MPRRIHKSDLPQCPLFGRYRGKAEIERASFSKPEFMSTCPRSHPTPACVIQTRSNQPLHAEMAHVAEGHRGAGGCLRLDATCLGRKLLADAKYYRRIYLRTTC